MIYVPTYFLQLYIKISEEVDRIATCRQWLCIVLQFKSFYQSVSAVLKGFRSLASPLCQELHGSNALEHGNLLNQIFVFFVVVART